LQVGIPTQKGRILSELLYMHAHTQAHNLQTNFKSNYAHSTYLWGHGQGLIPA
jgi:hypothetical protein